MKPLLLALLAISSVHGKLMPTSAEVFGEKYSRLDDRATSDWWKRQDANKKRAMINPHSPPSAPVQRRLQGTPAKSKFLAVLVQSGKGLYRRRERTRSLRPKPRLAAQGDSARRRPDSRPRRQLTGKKLGDLKNRCRKRPWQRGLGTYDLLR